MSFISFGSADATRYQQAPLSAQSRSDIGSTQLVNTHPDPQMGGGFIGELGGGLGKGAGIVLGLAAGYWFLKKMKKV